MSTRAKREGHAWIQGEINFIHNTTSEWITHYIPGGKHSMNTEVWCRFGEFNRLSYHHVWLLFPGMQELNKSQPWRVVDLKQAWRATIERIKVCKKPRLP